MWRLELFGYLAGLLLQQTSFGLADEEVVKCVSFSFSSCEDFVIWTLEVGYVRTFWLDPSPVLKKGRKMAIFHLSAGKHSYLEN